MAKIKQVLEYILSTKSKSESFFLFFIFIFKYVLQLTPNHVTTYPKSGVSCNIALLFFFTLFLKNYWITNHGIMCDNSIHFEHL